MLPLNENLDKLKEFASSHFDGVKSIICSRVPFGCKMYEYRCKILRVVDGDTVDVDIDLGFGVWMHKERIRLYGIRQRAGQEIR